MIMRLTLFTLLFAAPACAQSHHSFLTAKGKVLRFRTGAFLEHLALGAGTEIAVSHAAGGAQHWPVGVLAGGLVAGFKEGADAAAGSDTKKQAAFHALSILAGSGIAAAAWH